MINEATKTLEVPVQLVGLQDKDQSIFRVAARLLEIQGITLNEVAQDTARTGVVLLDADSDQGRSRLHSLQEAMKVIALSSEAVEKAKDLNLIEKPLRVQALVNLFLELTQQLENDFAVHLDEEPGPQEIAPPEVFDLNECTNILHALSLSVRGNKIIEVKTKEHGIFYINGFNGIVAYPKEWQGFSHFDAIAKLEGNALQLNEVSIANYAKHTVDFAEIILDELIWRVARLDLEHGLLPQHDANTTIKLTSWPRFVTTYVRPEYFHLAMSLLAKPQSLTACCQKHQVDLRYGRAFYNILYGFGLIEFSHAVPSNVVEFNNKAQLKSLFDKIRQRLFN